MTDILLIQPPIRDFYLTAKRTFPYGLACIASVLIDKGHSVDLVDGLARSKSRVLALPEELSYLKEFYGQPDRSPFALFHTFKHFGFNFTHIGKIAKASGAFLVGISSLFTPYAADALETAETVKIHHPSCKIVMGGHHPTAMPESVMRSPAVDFILRGEGEVSMPLLAEALAAKQSVEGIPGIVYRRSDGSLSVTEPVSMKDPGRYPLPATNLINHRFYRKAGKGSTVVMTSRGCPMKCTYCCVGSSCHLTYRRRAVDSVLREIETAVQRHDVGFVDFEDENLSLDREWFVGLLNKIEERFGKDRIELRAMNGLYPPSLDGHVIAAMKSAGFKILNLSLGSTSEKQLKRFNRPDVGRDFDRAIRLPK